MTGIKRNQDNSLTKIKQPSATKRGQHHLTRALAAVILVVSGLACVNSAAAQAKAKRALICYETFNKDLDTSKWQIEIAPVGRSSVYTQKGRLILDTKGGVTVWLKQRLKADIRIEYTRTVLVDTGTNDRLSDLNMFWMATDPRNGKAIRKDGVFESYDSLQLYYLGIGGNSNSTTRFRKYEGNGRRTLLKEFSDPAHLLEPNKKYRVVITVKGNRTIVSVNGQVFVNHTDEKILTHGYFGFRSTKSRHAIDEFKVYQLR